MNNYEFIELVKSGLMSFAESTRPIYLSELNMFARYIAPIALGEAKGAEAMSYLNHLHARRIQGEGLANKTIKRKIDSLVSMFDLALDFGGCESNPFERVSKLVKRMKKVQKRETVALDYSDVIPLIRGIESPRDRAIMAVMYGAGLRVSEVVTLDYNDVLFRDSNACLNVLTAKTRTHRPVMLPIWASKFLKDFIDDTGVRKNPEPLALFTAEQTGERLSRYWVWKLARRYFDATAHTARYTHISYLLDKGVLVQEIARSVGHERIQTTMGYDKRKMKYENSACVKADFSCND